MLSSELATVAYLAAGLLFILSLGGLSRQETARRGNLYGMIGMALAIAATTALLGGSLHLPLLGGAIGLGATIGAVLAARVAMTEMPQLVAILHSFVGLAAVLVGIASWLRPDTGAEGAAEVFHRVEIFIGVFIGAITFTGSIIAWAKLDGRIDGKPLMLPGRHVLNLVMVLGCLALGYPFLTARWVAEGLQPLLVMTTLSGILGAHLVMAIGGADMPVVVSMLNSYSGWAAAAAGFMLNNDLLIITGALVGSSGAILSYIMCDAMNRSFVSVILGGFGEGTPAPTGIAPPVVAGEPTPLEAPAVAELLSKARRVIVVPGYGLAVARGQGPLYELTRLLQANGAEVRFAIHPVAGRLPGHMNVLLAEARVPYDIVHEMEEINHDFPRTDLVLVVGANDIVNPGAETDPGSPIYGMPVLQVWEADCTVVMKRSLKPGYAGIDNPLFYREKTRMLFGDARASLEALLAELRS